MLRFLKIIISF